MGSDRREALGRGSREASVPMVDIKRFEGQLREREAYLAQTIERVGRQLEEPASKDDEERATEREGDEVLESLGSASAAELRAVRAALRRIEEGTYGECARCGKEIAEKRLEIIPHAALCARCA
jgi:RNA polymerase-binding transcription factor DksA